MNNNGKAFTTILAASAIALSAFAANVTAQDSKSGYLQDTRGEVVKNPYNLCWRTGYWSPAMAIAECDPDLVPKKPAPAARPAPAPAPAPRPAAPPPRPAQIGRAHV